MGFSQSVPSYVPTNGLVGWWGFNGNAQDGSGNGNHGTVNGATLTTDRFGNQNAAYDFDGVDDWIQVQDHVSLRPNHITMSAWFNLANLNGSYSIITKTNTQNASGEQYILGVDFLYNWKPNFQIKQGSNCQPGYNWQRLILNTSYSQNNWYHIVCTYDGTTLKIFQNGQLNSTNLVLNGVIDNCQGGSLNFGTFWANCCFIDGKLDDIGIWNRALTQQEINSLYNSQLSQPCTSSIASNLNISGCGFAVLSNGDTVNQSGTYLDTLTTVLGCDSILNQIVTIQPESICNPIPSYVPTSGLVGWWGFNGNAQDGSGNGYHGTVNGATITDDRFGNQNKAYNFDDSYITVNASQSMNFTDSLSINFWYKNNRILGGIYVSKHTSASLNSSFVIYNEGIIGCGPVNYLTSISDQISYVRNFNLCDTISWHMLSFVYKKPLLKMFIDGSLYDSVSNCGTIKATTNPIVFGGTSISSPPYIESDTKAFLDDIGIWNRALTSQEITNLYNSQLPTQASLCLPTITTSSPTSVGTDSVVIGGDISNDGGSSIVLRGVCYSTSPNPNMGNQRTEDGSGIGPFNTVLRGLNSSTTYYARSYAKNSNGVVVYGNEVSFTTSSSLPGVRCPGTPTVTDIDGNVYNTVQIGSQCWTQGNLKTSRYRNGDNIPTGLSNSAWQNATSGAYAIYNNDPMNDGLYGKLYNHYAVTDSRGLCPTGWHVPSDGEWTALVNHLGGSSVAGGALKSTATQPTLGGWNSPNTAATNSSGFKAIPGGKRFNHGIFDEVGHSAYSWSSSVTQVDWSWNHILYFSSGGIFRSMSLRTDGSSVRCLKD